jgi:hypothetical protein
MITKTSIELLRRNQRLNVRTPWAVRVTENERTSFALGLGSAARRHQHLHDPQIDFMPEGTVRPPRAECSELRERLRRRSLHQTDSCLVGSHLLG